jgi:hypothetical protein
VSPASSTQRSLHAAWSPRPARLLHLDLELHQAILTVLEYSGGERAGLQAQPLTKLRCATACSTSSRR